MELDELEVGERRAGAVGEQQAVADRAARVRRPLPERGIAAGREQRRARRHLTAGGDDADAAAAGETEPDRSLTLGDLDARLAATARASTSAMQLPVCAPPAWTTRRREWPPSRPSPSSNATPSATRSAIRAGASSVSSAYRARAAEAAPGRERVLGMQGRVVAGIHGCGDAALRGVAVRGAERPLREQEHRRPARGGGQGGVEARDAAADDHEVVRAPAPQFSPQSR